MCDSVGVPASWNHSRSPVCKGGFPGEHGCFGGRILGHYTLLKSLLSTKRSYPQDPTPNPQVFQNLQLVTMCHKQTLEGDYQTDPVQDLTESQLQINKTKPKFEMCYLQTIGKTAPNSYLLACHSRSKEKKL